MKWLMLALLAVLPLQWFIIAGPLRLHLLAMVLFGLVVLMTHRGSAYQPVLRVALPFVLANAVLCVVWFATNGYNGMNFRQPIQQLLYLGVFLAVATVIYRGVSLNADGFVELLRWAALVASVSLILGLSFSMITNGVNPAGVFAKTIASGDPEVLQKELFKSAFTGFGFDEEAVRGNFRHEVFGAILLAMCVSAACAAIRPFTSRRQRILYRLSIALGVGLIVVSMSRSVMIAAAIWPLLALVRSMLAARLTPRVVGATLLGLAVVFALSVIGLANVLWIRFTEDTGSYEARDRLYEEAYENLTEHMWTGGVTTAGSSSHNFVIDSWLRSGIFGGISALVVGVLVVGLLIRLAVNLHRESSWVLPTAALLSLPAVRMFTAGGGLIPPVSWIGLGVAAGLMAYRRQLINSRPDDDAEQTEVSTFR